MTHKRYYMGIIGSVLILITIAWVYVMVVYELQPLARHRPHEITDSREKREHVIPPDVKPLGGYQFNDTLDTRCYYITSKGEFQIPCYRDVAW